MTDCKGEPLPVFGKGVVTYCDVEQGAAPFGSVWNLKLLMLVDLSTGSTDVPVPAAGQFYLLRSAKSGVLLGRPISIYMARKAGEAAYLEFLILKKVIGSEELCFLEKNDEVELIGPLGNTFLQPKTDDKICIVG
ncbi:MAG: dihydroorotate dehydrogenase, partial [Treponema sp.]|nr:dihydroorotate dehydrogenase [Treponema sp.]